MWKCLLEALPGLLSFSVSATPCQSHPDRGLPEALGFLARTPDSEEAQFLVPNLTDLCLACVDLSDSNEAYRACFESRSRIAPLQKLHLFKCEGMNVPLLAEYINEVVLWERPVCIIREDGNNIRYE
ncbi:hypothetical protein BD410DRAFT_782771 [Rickenella mellea]|uniref:Uncharacterized protein n=1 Tax=Rickenella mellea TaxID=50990 RepID=A0A4Y7QL56_9AGAM|nr:hypothetical protein BD410DRAFT_782771 [Rickenella mellea]